MSGEVTVKLEVPILVDQKEVREISLRRIKVGDIIDLDLFGDKSMESNVMLLSRIAEPSMTILDFKRMDFVDFQECVSALEKLISKKKK